MILRLFFATRQAVKIGTLLALCLVLSLPVWAMVQKLSGTIPPFGDVRQNLNLIQQISADGQYVVFLVDKDTDELYELYSVPLGGGEPVKLNTPLTAGQAIVRFSITPDASRVVFQVNSQSPLAQRLFSAPISGGASPVPLHVFSGATEYSSDYALTPDSSRVVYSACPIGVSITGCGLYSVPVVGPAGSSVSLIEPVVQAECNVYGCAYFYPRISADSRYAVFTGRRKAADSYSIYSASLTTPALTPVTLTVGTQFTALWPFFSYEITPDSGKVVYASRTAPNNTGTLFVVPIAGPASASVQLSPSAQPGNYGVATWFNSLSPDGQHAVFIFNDALTQTTGLYSVPISGSVSNAIKLADVATSFLFSPNSQSVVFSNNGALSNVPIVGPSSSATPIASSANDYTITPDSSQVIFVSDTLYGVPLSGPPQAKRALSNATIDRTFHFYKVIISPDGTRAVYAGKAGGVSSNPLEVFSVPITGTISDTVTVSGPMITGGGAFPGFVTISPDSGTVIYLADQETDEMIELYASDAGRIPLSKLFLPLIRR